MALPQPLAYRARRNAAVQRPAPSHFSGFSSDNPVQSILPLVGGTPLVVMNVNIGSVHGRILVKYETLNFTGSMDSCAGL